MITVPALKFLSHTREELTQKKMVGLARVELATSSLSGMRSNQLSYKPTYHSQKKKSLLACSK